MQKAVILSPASALGWFLVFFVFCLPPALLIAFPVEVHSGKEVTSGAQEGKRRGRIRGKPAGGACHGEAEAGTMGI